LSRTQDQITANDGSMEAYGEKQQALVRQIEALQKELVLKRSQLENKFYKRPSKSLMTV